MLCFLRRFFNEDTPSFLEGTHVLEVGTQKDRSPQPQSQEQDISQAEEEDIEDMAQSTFVEGATRERLAPGEISAIQNLTSTISWPDPLFCSKCGHLCQGMVVGWVEIIRGFLYNNNCRHKQICANQASPEVHRDVEFRAEGHHLYKVSKLNKITLN